MKLSQRGLSFIKGNEGLRLEAYRDVGGRWTIGYGHLLPEPILKITEAQAESLLHADVHRAEFIVDSTKCGVLTQNQFDALVDFAFNVGIGAYINSTLLKRLRVGDFEGVEDEFPRWKYSNGQVVQGLINRRVKEIALFGEAENASQEVVSGL